MTAGPFQRLRGHYWTFRPMLAQTMRERLLGPPPLPTPTPIQQHFADAKMGEVYVSGLLHPAPDNTSENDTLLVVLHGLGGSPDSYYTKLAALAANRLGLACLRMAMRGADRQGADLYHAGLSDDIRQMLAAPALTKFKHIYLMGYSMGAHLVTHWTLSPSDKRVLAVAAMCPPMDLAQGITHIDLPGGAAYRYNVFRGLKESYRAIEARDRPRPLPYAEVDRIHHLTEWDNRVVAPRFGFRDAAHYWQEASVGPRLNDVACPLLVVAAENDPMISYESVAPALARCDNPQVSSVHVRRAGHVGFAPDIDLGLVGADGAPIPSQNASTRCGPFHAEDQVLRWLLSHSA